MPVSVKSSEAQGLRLTCSCPDPRGNRDEGSFRGRLSAECAIPVLHRARVAVHHGHGIPAGAELSPHTHGPPSPAFCHRLSSPHSGPIQPLSWLGTQVEAALKLDTTREPTAWPKLKDLEVALARRSVRVTLLDSSGASLSRGAVCPGPGQALETARVILETTLEPTAGQGTLCVPLSSCGSWLDPSPPQPRPILSLSCSLPSPPPLYSHSP